jgi:hypothetical protein
MLIGPLYLNHIPVRSYLARRGKKWRKDMLTSLIVPPGSRKIPEGYEDE